MWGWLVVGSGVLLFVTTLIGFCIPEPTDKDTEGS